jgi:prolyl 4-hydroxylase
MSDDATAAEFASSNDAARLAKIGAHVAARLNANPRVQRVDLADAQVYLHQGFLSLEECRGLIDLIDATAVPSALFAGTEQASFRTSYSCNLSCWDPLVSRVEARMSEVLGIANDYAETMQGQRYRVGQQFKPHHDFFNPDQPYWEHERLAGGQRTWTAMIFLDQPEAGGHTEFPELGFGVRPQAGRMLVWNNAKPDGTPNHKTLHTGTPVTAGVKHIVTKWYRQNNWREINAPKA